MTKILFVCLFVCLFVVLPFPTHLFAVGVQGLFSFDHTEGHITLSRTPLDEGSARRRDLYLTIQTLTREKHPRPRWDSNPQSQQALGRRPMPETARSLGSAD
jgi:hypothetical protein